MTTTSYIAYPYFIDKDGYADHVDDTLAFPDSPQIDDQPHTARVERLRLDLLKYKNNISIHLLVLHTEDDKSKKNANLFSSRPKICSS